ncbi:hypothetical protein SteCoe_32500 [Stentor coeruleus]|uniref:Nuclear cap-binding protein subunit 3 n=1 Tax=Stentor coeruleus TaxID=5963 RepID=A0A1R2AYY3_9CILI|nr:hypothetical protein SteCoe_32500 [Stentor coeruleus]
MESTWSEEYKKRKEREERFSTGEPLQLNDPGEREKQKNRMLRFETSEEKEVDYWEKYTEPSGDIRMNSLYLYGVDYLSTTKILNYFHYFSPSKVEWLNDTSCNVIFPNEDNALQALNTNCLDKIEDPTSFENIKRSALGYQVKDEVFPFYIRFSTAGDVKNELTKGKNSKYYKWKKQNSQGIRKKPITNSSFSKGYRRPNKPSS